MGGSCEETAKTYEVADVGFLLGVGAEHVKNSALLDDRAVNPKARSGHARSQAAER